MPEGDTIYRTARTLHRALAGGRVTRFETAFAHVQRAHDQASIQGRTIDGVTAAGKHVLIRLSGGLVLRTHMRMHGSWHIYRPGERWRRPARTMRVLIATDAFEAVAFEVPDAEWIAEGRLASSVVGRLGPDLLSGEFDASEALRRIRARQQAPVGEVLLDQHVVAGLGNVYRSEVLFLARIHPERRVADLDTGQLGGLIDIARRLLAANVADPSVRTIISLSGRRRTTGRSDPGATLFVYRRHGRPCRRCGSPILRGKLGEQARTVWWCPSCQPAPAL